VLNKIHPGRGVYEDGVLEIEKLKVELSWKLNEQKMKMIASETASLKRQGGGKSKMDAAVRFDEQVNVVTTTKQTGETEVQTGTGDGKMQGDYFGEYFGAGGENQFEK